MFEGVCVLSESVCGYEGTHKRVQVVPDSVQACWKLSTGFLENKLKYVFSFITVSIY